MYEGLYFILSLFVINDVHISCSKGIDPDDIIPEPTSDVWSVAKSKKWGDTQKEMLGFIICYNQMIRLMIRIKLIF